MKNRKEFFRQAFPAESGVAIEVEGAADKGLEEEDSFVLDFSKNKLLFLEIKKALPPLNDFYEFSSFSLIVKKKFPPSLQHTIQTPVFAIDSQIKLRFMSAIEEFNELKEKEKSGCILPLLQKTVLTFCRAVEEVKQRINDADLFSVTRLLEIASDLTAPGLSVVCSNDMYKEFNGHLEKLSPRDEYRVIHNKGLLLLGAIALIACTVSLLAQAAPILSLAMAIKSLGEFSSIGLIAYSVQRINRISRSGQSFLAELKKVNESQKTLLPSWVAESTCLTSR